MSNNAKKLAISLRIPDLEELHPRMAAQVRRAASFISKLTDEREIEAALTRVHESAFGAAFSVDPDDGIDALVFAGQITHLVAQLAGENRLRAVDAAGNA